MSDEQDDKLTLKIQGPKQKVVRQNVSAGQSKNVAVEIRRRKGIRGAQGPRPSGEQQGFGQSGQGYQGNRPGQNRDQSLTPEEIKNRADAVRRSLEKPKQPFKPQGFQKPGGAIVPETLIPEEKAQKSFVKDKIKRDKKFEEPAKPIKKQEFEKSRFKKVTVEEPDEISLSEEDEGAPRRFNRGSGGFKKRKKAKPFVQAQQQQGPVTRDVIIPDLITVGELANRMAVKGADVIKHLMKQGMLVTINQNIDADIAELVVTEFGHKAKRVSASDVEKHIVREDDNPLDLITRAPVVTIMGHVDHGKTSLLDALRKTNVVSTEAGGITQHIGAYRVTTPQGKHIVFIDTPGHAAFSSMRARGANVTDIVILLVAGDDGIKEQTVEAIHHAKSAKVPIIVAVNKMDKPGADVNRVSNELLQYELVPEALGGDIQVVGVSAKTGMGLDKLEEAILVQAEVSDLKGNPTGPASGVVLESRLEKGRGIVATVLVQRGTLKIGDVILIGNFYGRVKAMADDQGKSLKEASVSMPVSVLGLNGMPKAGDEMAVLDNEAQAISIAEHRVHKEKGSSAGPKKITLASIMENSGPDKTLAIIVKADTHGSCEAIKQSLEKLTNEQVTVKVVHDGVGGITENDISLAKASKAVVIAFNVRANPQAKDSAQKEGIEIQYYSIIYNIIDDIKKAMFGLLDVVKRDKFIGYAEIRQVISVSKVGNIAGCMVTEGVVQRGAKIRLLRDNVVIHEGNIKTLRRFKDEVKEVKQGFECGIAFENYNDIKVGDMIECSVEEVVNEGNKT